MSKVYGADKIRRTCLVRGREGEGRFGLLRKQMNVSKVLAVGQDGEGDDVATDLVYDERIAPRPARTPNKQAAAETKVYGVDKPLRRVCFVDGKDQNQKYHLLRKGAELSKVLAVGTEGQGEWINTSQIRDEHMVPIPAKARIVERKPVRLCKLVTTGDQEYLVLRKTDKGAKLLPVYDGNYGITITDLSQIVGEQVINQAKKGGRKAQEGEAQNDGEQRVEDATQPVSAPVAHAPAPAAPAPAAPAPAAPAPAAPAPAAPAQKAPVAAQPPRPVVSQPQRPATMPGAPRPQPVGAGAAPRAPMGRPSGR